MSTSEVVYVSVKLTKKDLEEFDRAVRKSKRFLNRSDALRQLIRDFIDASAQSSDLIDTDADCEVICEIKEGVKG